MLVQLQKDLRNLEIKVFLLESVRRESMELQELSRYPCVPSVVFELGTRGIFH